MFKEYNDKEVNKAVDSASLTNLISEKGYNYVCGEGGKFYQGGKSNAFP